MVANLFSIDIEDWFHVLDTCAAPIRDDWMKMESRLAANTEVLLTLLDEHQTKATFFVLGWVAENCPRVVKEIADRGHEIASHGYGHGLVYKQSKEEFRTDIRRAAEAIHQACGICPRGYRAPGFSILDDTLWALDVLVEEGYEYDSSIFPAIRGHGGFPGACHMPLILPNGLKEFPISTINVGFGRLAYLGGGYLRLIPGWLIQYWVRRQQDQGMPLILYLHPRDIDDMQPRLKLSLRRRFKTYVGLGRTMTKLDRLLKNFRWMPLRDYVW